MRFEEGRLSAPRSDRRSRLGDIGVLVVPSVAVRRTAEHRAILSRSAVLANLQRLEISNLSPLAGSIGTNRVRMADGVQPCGGQ